MQISMFQQDVVHPVSSRRSPPQLLKWVGNKQRFAATIVSSFPNSIGRYFEPFLGSGAVLGTLSPTKAIGSDCFEPLVEIWIALKERPDDLKEWYSERWHKAKALGKVDGYEAVKASYNGGPNGADLVFLESRLLWRRG